MATTRSTVRMCGGELVAVRKGPWTLEEDLILVSYISEHGEGSWDNLARAAGLNRNGKSCRLRWLNYLRPGVRRGSITPVEDAVIRELHAALGNKWSKIAKHLPGRTDNEIKNYWRTRIQKRPPPATTMTHHQQHQTRCQPATAAAAVSEGTSSSSGSASQDSSAAAAAGDCWFTQLKTEQQAAYYCHQEAPVVAAPTGMMVKSERASSALASRDDSSVAVGDCWFKQLETEVQQAYYCLQEAPVVASPITSTVKSEHASSALASQNSSTAAADNDCSWYTQASYNPYYYSSSGLSSAADHLGMVDVDATTTTQQFFSSQITDSFWSAVNNLWETIPVKGAF